MLLTHQSVQNKIRFFYFTPLKHGVRGEGGSKAIVLVDEISFMPDEFMKKVVFPLLLSRAIFFWITTIDDGDNMINTVVENIRSGKINFINLMQHSLACTACRDLGKATECTHKVVEHPRWNDPKMINLLQLLIDDNDTFLRETMGLQSMERSEKAFPVDYIKKLRLSRFDLSFMEPKYVFTSIDPAAGGKGSQYAIISSTFINGKLVIIGIDQIRSRDPTKNDDMVVQHFRSIKNLCINGRFPFMRSTNVLMIEACIGFEHYRISSVLNLNGIKCIKLTENKGDLGIWTTQFLKGKMVNGFKLGLEREIYTFATQFFTNSKKQSGEVYRPEEIIEEFCTQLTTFEKRYKYKTGVDNPSVIFTGKGANRCDDLVMAMLLSEEGRERFDLNANRLYIKD